MSPLIEEARRRQRRRRIALATLAVAVAAAAGVVAVLQRGGSAPRRDAETASTAYVSTTTPVRSEIWVRPVNEPVSVLKALVLRAAPRAVTYSVRVDPRSGKVELLTTTAR